MGLHLPKVEKDYLDYIQTNKELKNTKIHRDMIFSMCWLRKSKNWGQTRYYVFLNLLLGFKKNYCKTFGCRKKC